MFEKNGGYRIGAVDHQVVRTVEIPRPPRRIRLRSFEVPFEMRVGPPAGGEYVCRRESPYHLVPKLKWLIDSRRRVRREPSSAHASSGPVSPEHGRSPGRPGAGGSAGRVTRGLGSHDRRARIPLLTGAGRDIRHEVTAERDRAEAELLASFSPQEQRLLRDLLTRLTVGQPDAAPSCI
jgi:hypothetical protein